MFKNFDLLRLRLVCKDCKTDQFLLEDGADTVCTSCGLCVGSRLIDPDIEWRNFGDDDYEKSRVGAFSNVFDKVQLHTYIQDTPQAEYLIRAHAKCIDPVFNFPIELNNIAEIVFERLPISTIVRRAITTLIRCLTPDNMPRYHGIDPALVFGVFLYQSYKSFDKFKSFDHIATHLHLNVPRLKATLSHWTDYLHEQLQKFEQFNRSLILDDLGTSAAQLLELNPGDTDKLVKIIRIIQDSDVGHSGQVKTKVALALHLLLGNTFPLAKIADAVGSTVGPIIRIIEDWNTMVAL